MAKHLDPNKLLMSVKKENNAAIADSIVKRIHEKPADEKEKVVEETARTTFDFPKTLYKQIKLRTVELDMSIKDYLVGLAKKDLGIQ